MTRISYWIFATVSAVVLLFGFDASRTHPGTTTAAQTFTSGPATGGASATPSSTPSSSTPTKPKRTPASSTPTSTPSSTPTSTPSSTPSSAPASTVVTGSVVNTVWGPVQVQIRVTGGSISKIGILQYPNGNGRDIQIANYAFPVLIKETISSQSSHIDMVSGATYTSTGYIQSLQSAIDQAHL